MTTRAALLLERLYSGTPADKLASARRLHAVFAARPEETALAAALAELRGHAEALAAHMRRLDFGTLCSACASRTDRAVLPEAVGPTMQIILSRCSMVRPS